MKHLIFKFLLLAIVLVFTGAAVTMTFSYYLDVPQLYKYKDLIQLISLSTGLLTVLIITKSIPLLWQFCRKGRAIKVNHLFILLIFIAINILLPYLVDGHPDGAEGTTKIRMLQMFLIIPVLEELVFRGVFQSRLTQKYEWKTGILFSSLLFMAIHYGQLDYMLLCFVFSVFAGYLFHKTSSLLICITFHISTNIGIFMLSTL